MKIINGEVFCEDKVFRAQTLQISDGIFTDAAGGRTIDASNCYVIPGLVDVHTHGAMGADASDGDAQGLQTLSAWYAREGTTSFLATTMTLPESALTQAMETVRQFVRPAQGAHLDGVHLEGPFVSYAKRGAQAAEHLHAPDYAMFKRLVDASGARVKVITLAPEEPGALDFIRAAKDDCAISLGHSTSDYETAWEAFELGATRATHLFNAMPALNHRKPALIGAAMDCGAWVEVIADGLHIHPSVIRMIHRIFGERMVLISDSLRCTGMPDGEYTLGGQPIFVREGQATLHDGTIAGSSISMLDALRNCVMFGIPLADAVYAATAAPAISANIDDAAGIIAPGRRADCLILDKQLTLRHVIVGGEVIL